MVLIKNWQFFHLLSVGKIEQENVFHDIPEQKDAFFAHQEKKIKLLKIGIFPKGISNGFDQKQAIFLTQLPFFFSKISQEKLFYDILERNDFFLDYEKYNVKKVAKWGFGQENGLSRLEKSQCN